MHLKYLHYFGNESSEGILEAWGIMPKDSQQSDALKPKQCPNCNEPNKPDSRFCAKCRMVLTYDAYNETLAENRKKEDKLSNIEQRMRAMESLIENYISVAQNMDPAGRTQIAKQLFDNGLYEREPQ
jgi:hypothetical protein